MIRSAYNEIIGKVYKSKCVFRWALPTYLFGEYFFDY